MKYFVKNSERESTCYHEFYKGKWDEKTFWKEDSLLLHDDGPGTGFSIGDEDFEIAEQVIPKEGEKIFIKNINSCFGNKDFTV